MRARASVPPRPPPPPREHAVRADPVDGGETDATDEADFDAALQRLLAVPPSDVAPTARTAAPVALTLPFMVWLADQEDTATDAATRTALAAVGAALTAAREGLDGAPPPLPSLPAGLDDESAIEAALVARWRALGVARSAAAALAPTALAASASAAAALGADLTHRKAASAAALMGRVRLSPDAAAAALAGAAAGDATGRILGLLLEEADPSARVALLPDAFDPGEDGEGATPSDTATEQVWTTPLQLVAAIDLTLARLADAADAATSARTPTLTLAGTCPAAPEGGNHLVAVLEELRAAALEYVK